MSTRIADTYGSQVALGKDLSSIIRMLQDKGVTKLYVKALAPNDNSKNQIYLGGDLKSLNIIPVTALETFNSSSGKDSLKPGKMLIRGSLSFRWLDPEGRLHPVPGAKLILYPQYPEVRFSGYLQGSSINASKWMDVNKQGRATGRYLLIGIHPDGSCVGYLSVPGSAVSRELAATLSSGQEVLAEVAMRPAAEVDSKQKLLDELLRIHRASPIPGKKLGKDGIIKPYKAANGAGYTLEAELGISPNGYAEPDYEGWEVKACSGSVITLMTPEPNGGLYQASGVDYFVRTYGYPDKNGKPDRLNFGGVHRINETHGLTGLTMRLNGYTAGEPALSPDGSLVLVDQADRVAAEWSFTKLLEHWNRKHAKAAYVPYSADKGDGATCYSYADHVSLGEGTDFIMLLRAFATKAVYYDPGIKLVGINSLRPEIKRRSQFRIKSTGLSTLYESFEAVSLTIS